MRSGEKLCDIGRRVDNNELREKRSVEKGNEVGDGKLLRRVGFEEFRDGSQIEIMCMQSEKRCERGEMVRERRRGENFVGQGQRGRVI